MQNRKPWGWGVVGGGLGDAAHANLTELAAGLLGVGPTSPIESPIPDARALPKGRLSPADIPGCPSSSEPLDRARHTYGQALRDVVRALEGDFEPAPDLIAHPRSEAEVEAVLETCDRRGFAAIPFGGGTSVVGGIEGRGLRGAFPGVVSVDLTGLDRVLELDPTSQLARIQAGSLGPVLEDQLRAQGFTLRFFPQSFEFSTLGGWIATRAGGHFATRWTHIDDLTSAVRLLTPRGWLETPVLPASGAGPDPNAMVLGSEGAFGVITEATVRVRRRPRRRASVGVRFDDFFAGARAVRGLVQSGLAPAQCRLLDPTEAMLNGADFTGRSVLVLGFESADLDPAPDLSRALELVRDHGGVGDAPRISGNSGPEGPEAQNGSGHDPDAELSQWRRMFLSGPYLRDHMVRCGLIAETFETACPWRTFEGLVEEMRDEVGRIAGEVCGTALVTCRLTHLYPDGPAPYFTVIAPGGGHGARVGQWDAIKAGAMEVLARCGGTITHHHAVGRDHLPGYERERPHLHAEVLAATKRTLDPRGILNPGVLGI